MEISALQTIVKNYCEARDWGQYHDPTSLAIGIITESSELLEHFRFKSKEEALALFNNPEKRQQIEEELADIFYFILRFAQMNNIDLAEALKKKMEKNEKHYPVEKSKGSNKKYSEL